MKTLFIVWALTLSQLSFAVSVEDHPLVYESYSLEAVGKYSQAIEKMTLILAKRSDDYFVNYRLGWLFSLHKKYKNAAEHYKNAAKINPTSLEPWLALSLLSVNLGVWPSAVTYSEEILKRNVDSYYGNLRYIMASIQLKSYANALEKVDSILKSYPTDVIFLEQKAFVLAELGKTDAAKKVILDLLLLSPENVYARSFMNKLKSL